MDDRIIFEGFLFPLIALGIVIYLFCHAIGGERLTRPYLGWLRRMFESFFRWFGRLTQRYPLAVGSVIVFVILGTCGHSRVR